MPRLTRTTVQNIPLPASGELAVMDSELTGFGVRVLASGVRTYFVRYRVGGGRRAQMRRLTIGRHDHLTTEQARDAARKALAAVSLGGDPAASKAAVRDALTVSELIDEWLAGPGKRNRHGKLRSKGSYACDEGRFTRHVKPILGRVKLPDLHRADIEGLRDAIASGRTATTEKTKLRGLARVTGGEGAATRTLRALSVVLNYAVERGYLVANPTAGVKKTPDSKCERFLSVLELERLGRALDLTEGQKDPRGLSIIRLLALTGCRRREIEGLRWDEVDLERGFLRLKDSKTGAKVVFLSRAAAALLARVPVIAGSPWVFPATTGVSHYQNASKVWREVRSLAKLEGVRLHDLRHTYASQSLSEGASLEVVAALLGHKERRTTERYAHLASDPIKEAANRVGVAIELAMRG